MSAQDVVSVFRVIIPQDKRASISQFWWSRLPKMPFLIGECYENWLGPFNTEQAAEESARFWNPTARIKIISGIFLSKDEPLYSLKEFNASYRVVFSLPFDELTERLLTEEPPQYEGDYSDDIEALHAVMDLNLQLSLRTAAPNLRLVKPLLSVLSFRPTGRVADTVFFETGIIVRYRSREELNRLDLFDNLQVTLSAKPFYDEVSSLRLQEE